MNGASTATIADQLIQGSDEWAIARCGSVGASRISDIMARTKSGWGASRANYAAELIAERLTGIPANRYQSAEMRWGIETEPQARDAYAFYTDADVVQIGLVKHPSIHGSHASPDGLVGDNGLLEIKSPNTSTHIETLLTGAVPGKYATQMLWQMACTGRQWCDYVSFDPRMPEHMRYWCKRVHRDDALIAELEREVAVFLGEVADKVAALQAKYPERIAA